MESPIFSPDNHLKSAIMPDIRIMIASLAESPLVGDTRRIPEMINQEWTGLHRQTTHLIESSKINPGSEVLYSNILQANIRDQEYSKHMLIQSFICAEEISRSIDQKITETPARSLLDIPILEGGQTFSSMLRYHSLMSLWQDIRDIMKSKKGRWYPTIKEIPGFGTAIIGSKIILNPTTGYLLDYSQVLMFLDIFTGRYQTILHLSLHHVRNDIILAPVSVVESLYSWGENVLRTHGNQGYTLLKSLEAVCTAILIKDHDWFPLKREFYDILIDETSQEHKECGCVSHLQSILDKSLPAAWLVELAGLFRHWGHPTVDERAGLEKIRKITQEARDDLRRKGLTMRGETTRLLTLAFIRKKGTWPPCDVSNLPADSVLRSWAESGATVLNEESPGYEPKEWAKIKMKKTFDFDPFVDYTALLDDKSVSPPRDKFDSTYNSKTLGYTPPTLDDREHKRLLLGVMARSEGFDGREILKIIQHRKVPRKWKVIGCHPKERELKIHPRMFIMMVMEMRYYYCALEKNIANNILPLLKQQTMTCSESELSKKVLEETKILEDKGDPIRVSISMDFSSWNTRWRHELMLPLLELFDELFDTPGLFTYAHEFFLEAMVFLSSSFNPPPSLSKENRLDPDEEEGYLYYGHNGGFDGMMQKIWTTATIALIEQALRQTGLRGNIIGQGDNQVVELYLENPFPGHTPKEAVEADKSHFVDLINEFRKVLQEIIRGVGHELKMEETWVSATVFLYGKEPTVAGASLPGALKKASRIFDDTNNIVPSLDNRIATIHTAAHSAANKGLSWCIPYLHAYIESLQTIVRELVTMRSTGLSSRYTFDQAFQLGKILTLLPSVFGGLPNLPWTDYMMRGHPDPLTSALACLKATKTKESEKILQFFIVRSFKKKGGKDLIGLVESPTSIPSFGGVKGTSAIKTHLENLVSSLSRNKDIKELMRAGSSEESDKFKRWLITMNPFFPRLANELYMASPAGAANRFLGAFGSLSTVRMLISETEQEEIAFDLARVEAQRFLSLVKYASDISSMKPDEYDPTLGVVCLTSLARALRKHLYSTESEIIGVTVPHPLEFLEPVRSFCWGSISVDVESRGEREKQSGIPLVLIRRGKMTAYIGSPTPEKRGGRLVQIPLIDRPFTTALRLQQIKTWVSKPEGHLEEGIDKLTAGLTSIPVPVISALAGDIIGGAAVHRLADTISKKNAQINTRTTFATHCRIHNDAMTPYSMSQDDYAHHVQGSLLHCQASLSLCAERGLVLEGKTFKIICHECLYKVYTGKMDMSTAMPKLMRIDSPLFYSQAVLPETQESVGILVSLKEGGASKINGSPRTVGLSIGTIVVLSAAKRIQNISLQGVTFLKGEGSMNVRLGDAVYAGLRNILAGVILAAIGRLTPQILFSQFKPSVSISFEDAIHNLLETNPHGWLEGVSSMVPSMVVYGAVLPQDMRIIGALPQGLYGGADTSRGLLKIVKKMLPVVVGEYREGKRRALVPLSALTEPSQLLFYLKTFGVIRTSKEKESIAALGKRWKEVKREEQGEDDSIPNDWISQVGRLFLHLKITKLPFVVSESPIEATARIPENERVTFIPIINKSFIGESNNAETTPTNDLALLPSSQLHTYALEEDFSHLMRDVQGTEEVKFFLGEIHAPTPKTRGDHLFRSFGKTTTGGMKMYEILINEGVVSPQPEIRCCCLAEGSGGMAHVLLEYLKPKSMVFNTKIPDALIGTQHPILLLPAEVSQSPYLSRIDTTPGMLHGGDLNNALLRQEIIESGPFALMTCDAERPLDLAMRDDYFFYKGIIQVMSKSLTAKGIGIVKIYLRSPTYTSLLLALSLSGFGQVKLVVPSFSSFEGREAYAILRTPTPHKKVRSPTNYLKLIPDVRNLVNNRTATYRPYQARNSASTTSLLSGLKLLMGDDNKEYLCEGLFGVEYEVLKVKPMSIRTRLCKYIRTRLDLEDKFAGGSLRGLFAASMRSKPTGLINDVIWTLEKIWWLDMILLSARERSLKKLLTGVKNGTPPYVKIEGESVILSQKVSPQRLKMAIKLIGHLASPQEVSRNTYS